ncbi:MAG: type VII toxin-antitoxin system HepT family RNase toxin [Candidatus Njordarchaeia archaeon]|nr:DUF86 domain-containing protein [Candidatus Korarchaeota archaeon]
MDKQDKEIIEIKIRQIELSFDLIRNRLPSTLQKFLSLDVLVRDGIYKRIEFIIQNILDILAIFTKYFKKIPGDDESVIEILQKANFLNPKTAEIIKKMRGFRNFLVHRYGELFDEIAFNNISAGLQDIVNVIEFLRNSLNKLDP